MGDEPLLLDTCAFLDWALGGAMKKAVVGNLEHAAREGRVFLSPLSVQETMRLAEKGRLKLTPTALSWTQRAMRKMRLSELSFTWDAALEAGVSVDVNGDPVDRGLLGAAIVGGFTLVTRDEDLLRAAGQRGVPTMDTRP